MGFADTPDRSGIASSFESVLTFQALFFKHFSVPVEKHFGAAGEEAVTAALSRYGQWRGTEMASRHAAKGLPRCAETLTLHWDVGDWHCFGDLGEGHAEGNCRQATVTTVATPMWDYWRSQGLAPLARRYYAAVYPAIAKGYGIEVKIPASGPDLSGPWSVTWSAPGYSAGSDKDLKSTLLNSTEDAVELLRWSCELNGALYYFLADEATRRFDMAGEAVVRESVRNLALERASAQKARHEAMGLPRNMETLMNHWDGNLVKVWEFDEGVLTPGTWHQDCTWCPYAAVWESFGQRALDLGYLYDYELHPTLYRAYHPDAVVQFEAIKTRGDSHCKFRVSCPSLQKEGEPSFAGYAGKDR